MHKAFLHILDFLFPPSPVALELRTLLPGEIFARLPAAEPLPYPFVTALFSYKFPLTSELISSIKNKKDAHAFRLAAYALYKRLPEKGLLVPIPLSKKRLRERGYNQCELIIEEILKLDTEKRFEKNFTLLKRVKHTGEQKLKNRKERLENSGTIFQADFIPSELPVILIDDVATTGSTLDQARDALEKAGYAHVRAFTVAH